MSATTRRTRRYWVESIDDNRCVLHGTNEEGEPVAVTYWAPDGGGYVRRVSDRNPGQFGQQVCDRLEGLGSTLEWSGKRPLVELIRAEARAAVRAAAAEDRREYPYGPAPVPCPLPWEG